MRRPQISLVLVFIIDLVFTNLHDPLLYLRKSTKL
jgi:hypothetical protein